jgi:hypothetical protein
MKRKNLGWTMLLAGSLLVGSVGCDDDDSDAADAGRGDGGAVDASADGGTTTSPNMTFFITSRTGDGNLGGLTGADTICNTLAAAAGVGNKQWFAYLSTTTPLVHAKERIGEGPWYNAAGVKIADTNAELHNDNQVLWPQNDPSIALDERGRRVPGREDPEIPPNEHDIITGTNKDGTAHPDNCNNWTDGTAAFKAMVGHHDRRAQVVGMRIEWNGAHTTSGCAAGTGSGGIGSGGGAGRFYCFAKKP